MTNLNLTPDEVDAVVKFMEVGLTDPRVAWERAPFDHPSLVLPQGHVGDENAVTQKPVSPKITTRQAMDANIQLKPIGAEGRRPEEGPLQPFYNDI
ncbi:hypothetical protein D9M71_839240 [compost metagenome]